MHNFKLGMYAGAYALRGDRDVRLKVCPQGPSSSGSIRSSSSIGIISAGAGGGLIAGGGVIGAVQGWTKNVHLDGAVTAVHVRCDAQPGYSVLAVGGSDQSG